MGGGGTPARDRSRRRSLAGVPSVGVDDMREAEGSAEGFEAVANMGM